MKKTFLIPICLLMVCLFSATLAHAGLEEYKIVGALNDTTQKSIFSWNEKPYLYIKFLNNGIKIDIESTWYAPSGADFGKDANDVLETWLSFDNWHTIKETGLWEVTTDYFYTDLGSGGSASTTFTVTPEPLAALLYIIGGAPVLFGLIRRKKLLVS